MKNMLIDINNPSSWIAISYNRGAVTKYRMGSALTDEDSPAHEEMKGKIRKMLEQDDKNASEDVEKLIKKKPKPAPKEGEEKPEADEGEEGEEKPEAEEGAEEDIEEAPEPEADEDIEGLDDEEDLGEDL